MDEKKRWIIGGVLAVVIIVISTIGAMIYQDYKIQKEKEAANELMNQMYRELEQLNKQVDEDLKKDLRKRGFNP